MEPFRFSRGETASVGKDWPHSKPFEFRFGIEIPPATIHLDLFFAPTLGRFHVHANPHGSMRPGHHA
jgi:hypothetical protein